MTEIDIVTRLRDQDAYADSDICHDAADEIERLRGAMAADDKRLREAGQRVGIIQGCDTPDAMADEIERLRAALAVVADPNMWSRAHECCYMWDGTGDLADPMAFAASIAVEPDNRSDKNA